MRLNIHLLSNPIIQNLSNINQNSSLPFSIKNQANKHLGIFIIYETLRKWIKIYKLTIKQVQSKKDINIIDPKESFTIIFDTIDNLSLLQELPLLLPRVNLQLLEHQTKNSRRPTIQINSLSTKVIIINEKINVEYIKNIITDLKIQHNIEPHQIYITCLICSTHQLIKLSERYSHLNIYTTKIIKT